MYSTKNIVETVRRMSQVLQEKRQMPILYPKVKLDRLFL